MLFVSPSQELNCVYRRKASKSKLRDNEWLCVLENMGGCYAEKEEEEEENARCTSKFQKICLLGNLGLWQLLRGMENENGRA